MKTLLWLDVMGKAGAASVGWGSKNKGECKKVLTANIHLTLLTCHRYFKGGIIYDGTKAILEWSIFNQKSILPFTTTGSITHISTNTYYWDNWKEALFFFDGVTFVSVPKWSHVILTHCMIVKFQLEDLGLLGPELTLQIALIF